MRDFVVAMCLLAVIASGSIISMKAIDNISLNMKTENTMILEDLENKNYLDAYEKIDVLRQYIQKNKFLLGTTMDHNYVNTIEAYIAEMEQYIKNGQGYDAMAKNRVLDTFFENYPKNYKLKFENIL